MMQAVIRISCIFSVCFFLYTILCKVNYYRYPFSYYAGFTIEESTTKELYLLCAELIEQANELREQILYEDENGMIKLSEHGLKKDFKLVSNIAKESYENIGRTYQVLDQNYSGVKPIYFSEVMSYMETTGIFLPFSMEATINVNVPEYTIPSTMCHELAHLRGFMREEEANYISYITCMASDSIVFQYSGTMNALSYAMNKLYREDKELYFAAREMYSEKVMRDALSNVEYWNTYRGTMISKVADKVNDVYLKSNNQPNGTKSYGQMVDLLLAEWRLEN